MSVLSLTDAKVFLNIDDTTSDAELMAFIDAAEAAVAKRVGPLSTSTLTKRVPGYAWELHLPIYPAVSLTSVTPVNGTALTIGDFHLEPDVGAVSYNSGSFFSSLAYDVVYVAGRSPVPTDLLELVKKRLKIDWNSQRGSAARPGPAPAQIFDEERAYESGIAPHELLPGLA